MAKPGGAVRNSEPKPVDRETEAEKRAAWGDR